MMKNYPQQPLWQLPPLPHIAPVSQESLQVLRKQKQGIVKQPKWMIPLPPASLPYLENPKNLGL